MRIAEAKVKTVIIKVMYLQKERTVEHQHQVKEKKQPQSSLQINNLSRHHPLLKENATYTYQVKLLPDEESNEVDIQRSIKEFTYDYYSNAMMKHVPIRMTYLTGNSKLK